MSKYYQYPYPTQEQLEQDEVYVKSFTPFWWSIVQGMIVKLLNERKWTAYDEDLEKLIQALLLPDEN